MINVALSRRLFVQSIGALGVVSAMPVFAAQSTYSYKLPVPIISSVMGSQGDYAIVRLNPDGKLSFRTALPGRGHQVTFNVSRKEIIVVARRPERWMLVIDSDSGEVLQRDTTPKERHFYGHAVFSEDGQYLYTAENRISDGMGVITVRDANARYRIVNQFPSYGIGPHELKMMPDGVTLVVANGGILTHPNQGRKKLNIETMKPSLAYIDSRSGVLKEDAKLHSGLHLLSIRHLDVNHRGKVVLAMQYQGEPFDRVPLVGYHNRGESIKLLDAPEGIALKMKHYCGSVCFDQSGDAAIVSSPKGDLITRWDLVKNTFVDSYKCIDGCGLAPAGNHDFIVSSGAGKVFYLDVQDNRINRIHADTSSLAAWDNHLSVL